MDELIKELEQIDEDEFIVKMADHLDSDDYRYLDKLRQRRSTIEQEFVDSETPELKELFDEYSDGDSIAALLVELGDAISVLQYVNREIIHGNKHEDMQIIRNEVSLRIVKLFDKLDSKLKENK